MVETSHEGKELSNSNKQLLDSFRAIMDESLATMRAEIERSINDRIRRHHDRDQRPHRDREKQNPHDSFMEKGDAEHGDQSFKRSSSTWSKPYHSPCIYDSRDHFSYFAPTKVYQPYAFAGDCNYLEWERNIDNCLRYHQIPKKNELAYAITQLTGFPFRWCIKEIDDRSKPSITTWGNLKMLLRSRYAPKEKVKGQFTAKEISNVKYCTMKAKIQKVFQEETKESQDVFREETQKNRDENQGLQETFHEGLQGIHDVSRKELHAFHDVFHEHPQCLPPIRGIEHQIDFLPGASLSNKPKRYVEKEDVLTLKAKQLQITNQEIATNAVQAKVSDQLNQNVSKFSYDVITHLACTKEAEKGTGEKEKPRDEISSHTPTQMARGKYLDSKNRMKPNLLSLGLGQTSLSTTLFTKGDYNDARVRTNNEPLAEVVTNQANRISYLENSFDIGALRGAYLINQREFGNQLNCSGKLILQGIHRNWNHHHDYSDQKVMNFSNWPHLNLHDLDVYALQGALCSNQNDSSGKSTCSRFSGPQGTMSNQFEAEMSSELKVINVTKQVILRMPNSRSRKIGSLQAYIWKPVEYSKLSIYSFTDLFINDYTYMMHLSLSNEPNTAFRKVVNRSRRIYKQEEDKRFKPTDLDQDKHQGVNFFLLIKEEPPDYNFNPKPNKYIFGIRLLLYDFVSAILFFVYADLRNASRERNNACQRGLQGKYNESSIFKVSDLVHFIADELDLRSNPFQVGEYDVILPSTKDLELEEGREAEEQLVPEQKELKYGSKELKELKDGSKEQLEPEEAEDKDLHVPLGPFTRSKQARLQQELQQLLHTIHGSLECAYPTTLVVIQAT